MPVSFEDTLRGSTDISGQESGQHPPFRPPSQRSADLQRSHKYLPDRGLKLQDGGGGLGGMFSALGSKAHELAGDVGQWRGEHELPAEARADWNPIDWAQEDASTVWHFAQDRFHDYSAFIDPGNISNFIQRNWEMDDSKVRNQPLWRRAAEDAVHFTTKWAARLGAEGPLGAAAAQQFEAHGQPIPGEKEAVPVVAGQEASALADPLSYVVPEGRAARAAQLAALVGRPAAGAALTRDPDEQKVDLVWAGLTAATLGRLPPELRGPLRRAFGRWGNVEKGINEAKAAREKAANLIADPAKHDQHVADTVRQQLDAGDRQPITATPPRQGLQRLVEKLPGEPDLRDPASHIGQLDKRAAGAADEHLADLGDLVHELKSGLWATHDNPSEQILRSLAGHARSMDTTFNQYFTSLSKLLGSVRQSHDIDMMKAAEGDLEVYRSLKPEQRLAVDSWRVLAAAMRESSEGTQYAKNFVPNWVPRVNEFVPEIRGRGRPSRASILAREVRASRALEEQVDPASGRTVLGQKYPTVQATNQALRQARESLVTHLTDYSEPLRKGLAENPEAVAIRNLAKTDMQAAQHRAGLLAKDHYPLKSEGFLQSISRVAGYQGKSILTQRGLGELAKTIIRTARADGTALHRAAAIDVSGLAGRDVEDKLGQGYESIADPKFRNWLFDKDVAGLLRRYMQQDFGSNAGVEAAAKINRQLLRFVMFSPHIHGANIARRMGALSMNHPIEFARLLKQYGPLVPGQMDDARRALRREARQSGVLPPRQAKGWQSQFADTTDSAFGDSGEHVHLGDSGQSHTNKMVQALAAPKHGYEAYESGFWRWVGDFAVAAYHIEKQSLLHAGKSEADARALAARRANTWAGFVAPEDTNPTMQKFMKLGIFAPNWWRTMGELMVPVYKRSGVFEGRPEMIKHAAVAGLKTTAAMLAFMKLSGQAVNVMMSGHLQGQNQPGHEDDIEVTNPAILHALQRGGLLPDGVDLETGISSKTGARMTFRIGGQFEDVLQAMGLESGQAGTPIGPGLHMGPAHLQLSVPGSAEDSWDGLTRFAAARLSPIMNDTSALFNLDLYHTLTGGLSPRAEVPGTRPGMPNLLSVAAAAIMAAPGGSQLAQTIQRNISEGGGDTTSLFGTQVPTSVGSYLKDLGVAGERAALTGLLGVNAPYAAAQKTRGTPLSDDDYNKVRQLTADYDKQQNAASAAALSGQITPHAWYQQYRQASAAHREQMRGLFHGAPQYVNGASGMAADYQALHDEATDENGIVDHTKLSELQAQFRSEHTPEQLTAMQSELKKNRDKYPMLKLYHNVQDAHDKFQEDYAANYGLDAASLRGELSEYNSLTDAQEQRRYLSQHPEVRRYRTAVTRQFDRSTAGNLYVLFHGDSRRAMRAWQASHLTFEEAEAELESAA